MSSSNNFITKEGLKKLDEYKYISGGYSWLDNKINPFWVWFVDNLVPLTMAPNLMTTLGLFWMSLSYIVMLYYDLSLTHDVPSWTYFFAGICIFIYQTLDACDGKQARKTKSSSPLGQLVDHGCDSFAINFMFLSVIQAVGIPRFHIIFCYIGMQYIFWTSQWYENHTKILMTNVGNIGVTEIELIIILLHFITGIFGRQIWGVSGNKVFPNFLVSLVEEKFTFGKNLLELPLYEFVYWVIVTLMILINIIMVVKIMMKQANILEQLAQFIPVTIIVFLEILIYQIPLFQEKYLGLVLMSYGVLFSLICCKIIICSMTEMRFPTFHWELIIPTIITVYLYFNHNKHNEQDIILMFATNILAILGSIYWFLHGVIIDITTHLGIYCFSLDKVKKN